MAWQCGQDGGNGMSDPLAMKVEARSLVDVVAERIEEAIISGKLEPGSRLSEQALAASLGVSRGPLREAIRRLEGRKLLTRTPNIGVRVAALSLKDLHEILQIREVLEGRAAALAASRMSAEEISGLQALLTEHEQQDGLRDGTGYYQQGKDLDFHFRIARGSGNERLVQMLCGDLYDLLRVYRYRSSTNFGRARDAFGEHRAIVSAIAAHDSEAAETAMRQHLRHAQAIIEEQLATGAEAETTMRSGRVRAL